MKYRVSTLNSEESLTSAGTKTIDINLADMISRIVIAWRVSKSKHGMDSYAHKDITKIELVDGSDVLHSLDGGQNQALCIYDRKCPTMNHGQHFNGNSDYSVFGIDFGRYLWDPELAFNPRDFKNPQLKITFNFAVSDTGVTTGYLEVWAYCFDEKAISPIGFLSAKNFESWSLSAAGAYHYVDLPTDRIIRKMMIQGYRSAYEPWYQVIEARLSEDNDKRIPFDWDLEDYHRVMKGIWTPVSDQFYGHGDHSGNYAFYVTPTDYFVIPALTAVGDVAQCSLSSVAKGGYFKPITTVDAHVLGIIQGFLPNHCFEIPFGNPMDLEDWYDVSGVGSLRLRLKSGTGSSGNVDTILQQLRKY
jgi:hypothetical protein